MKTINKVQAVIYALKDKKPYFLVMHRVLHWKGWEFVKGTPEKGETPRQTILREIREETRLKDVKTMKWWKRSISFTSNGQKYRISHVFLIKVNQLKPVVIKQRVQEHDGYLWVSKEKALKLLTYKNAKELLKNLHRNLFK